MDFNLSTALQIINMVGTFAVGVWLYLEKRNDKTNERVAEVEKALKKQTAEATNAIAIIKESESAARVECRRQCDDDIEAHSERITRVEEVTKAAPSHEDLAKIYDRINDVAEEVSTLTGQLGGIETNLRTILNRIIEKGMP